MSGVFTAGKLKLMARHIAKVGQNFEEHVAKIAAKGEDVCMNDLGSLMTLDGLASAGYGIETNSFIDPENEFRVQAMKLIGAPGYAPQTRMLKVMFTAICPWVSKILNVKVLPPDSMKYFSNILKITYEQRLKSTVKRNDIVDVIMEELKNSNAKKAERDARETEFEKDAAFDTKGLGTLKEAGYDEESLVVANALMLFFVGFDTTSTGFAKVVHTLALYPDCQEKVLDEIDDVIGSNEDVTYEQIQKLKYMDMFMNETYRHNMTMTAHERRCSKDYQVPDTNIVIPRGRYVKIYFKDLTRRPDYFTNPDEFDPENFLPENKHNKFGQHVFGHGPRNCIGMRYANMTIKICLVYLLKKHRVVQGPNFKPELEADPNNIGKFKGGVMVKVETR